MSKPEAEILGSAGGLVGRPLQRQPNDDVEHGVVRPDLGAAIPANCLRVLNSPLPPELGGGCSVDCPGYQRDDSCLCDIVRAGFEQGIRLDQLQFEVDEEGFWNYVGHWDPVESPFEA